MRSTRTPHHPGDKIGRECKFHRSGNDEYAGGRVVNPKFSTPFDLSNQTASTVAELGCLKKWRWPRRGRGGW
jgi:hypothetical protein